MIGVREISGLLALILLFSAACRTTDVVSVDTSPEENGLVHITRITHSTVENGTSVKVYGTGKLEYTSYKLSNPLRLAVEVPDVILDFEPRRVEMDDSGISFLNVVRFPKINSVRIELELLSNAPFSVSSGGGYLEIVVSHAGGKRQGERTHAIGIDAISETTDEAVGLKEALEKLREENDKLKLENLQSQKETRELLGENRLLEQRSEETLAQFEKSEGMTKALKARTEFMEKRLGELQAEMSGRLPPSSLKANLSLPSPAPMKPEKETLDKRTGDADSMQTLEEIRKMLDGWLAAWNWKDFLKYSAYYSSDFMNRGKWLEDKGQKFATTGGIKIEVKKTRIRLLDTQNAVAVFEQTFKSPAYRDNGVKTLTLVKNNAEWQIVSESWKPL